MGGRRPQGGRCLGVAAAPEALGRPLRSAGDPFSSRPLFLRRDGSGGLFEPNRRRRRAPHGGGGRRAHEGSASFGRHYDGTLDAAHGTARAASLLPQQPHGCRRLGGRRRDEDRLARFPSRGALVRARRDDYERRAYGRSRLDPRNGGRENRARADFGRDDRIGPYGRCGRGPRRFRRQGSGRRTSAAAGNRSSGERNEIRCARRGLAGQSVRQHRRSSGPNSDRTVRPTPGRTPDGAFLETPVARAS